jgi:hypothetical protein
MIARLNASIVLPFLLTALRPPRTLHQQAPTQKRKAVTRSLTLLPLKTAASERKC